METAKVDIRKLQLLNDRINQVIDALHQVRLSVHALQQGYQSQQQPYGAGFGTQAFGPFQGFNPLLQQNPFQQTQTPFQQNPFQQTQQSLFQQNPFQQTQQSPLQQNPFQQMQQNPFQQSFGQGMNPLFGQGFQQGNNPLTSMTQMNPQSTGATPGLLHSGTPWFGQGLSHTGSEQDLFSYNRPIWSDPLLAARLSSTFPYAHYPVPPVVTLF